MTRPLDITGKIHAMLDGEDVSFTAHGRELVVDFPTPRTFKKALKHARTWRTRSLHALHKALSTADLVLAVTVNSHEVARLGSGVRPSFLAKILGYGPVKLHFLRLLRL